MKRVLLWLVTCLFAVSAAKAAAPDVYVLGVKDNWSDFVDDVKLTCLTSDANADIVRYHKVIDFGDGETTSIQIVLGTDKRYYTGAITKGADYVPLQSVSGSQTIPVSSITGKVNVIVKLTKAGDTYTPELIIERPLFLVGGMNEWTPGDTAYQFERNDNGTYSIKLNNFASDFKIVGTSWGIDEFTAGQTLDPSEGKIEFSNSSANSKFSSAFTGTLTIGKFSDDGKKCTMMWPIWVEDPVFATTKDYYIDASGCTWFFAANAVIKVSDGDQDIECQKVTDKILKFRLTTENQSSITIKRINPNNLNETWNSYNLSAPTDASHNQFSINSDFNGGDWGVYTATNPDTPPAAWIISKNVNGWSPSSISEYQFEYNEETGIYTITVPADKLRSSTDNGFKIGFDTLNNWDNYYGASGGSAKTLERGVETGAVKNGKNFLIPGNVENDVTLTLNPSEGKLTAYWEVPLVKKNIYLKGVNGWTNNTRFVYDESASEEGTKHVYKIDEISIDAWKEFRFGDENGYDDVCLSLQSTSSSDTYWITAASGSDKTLNENSETPMIFSEGDFTGSLTITQTSDGYKLSWDGTFKPHVFDLYLGGRFGGTNWVYPIDGKLTLKESTDEKNVYEITYTISAGTEFKIETKDGVVNMSTGGSYAKGQLKALTGSATLWNTEYCQEMYFTTGLNFSGKLTVTQTLSGWTMDWTNITEPVDPVTIYLRGLAVKPNGTQDWTAQDEYKFKLDETASTDMRKVYTWYGSIRPNVTFKIGDANWSKARLTRSSTTANYKVTAKNTTSELKLYNSSSAGNIYFDYYFTGTITVYQTSAGWTWKIKYDDDALAPVTDLYLRGLGGNWTICDEKLKFAYEPDYDETGKLAGYIYTLDNVKINGGTGNTFKIGTKSLKSGSTDWKLALMLDAASLTDYTADPETGNVCLKKSGVDKKLTTNSGTSNMYFATDMSEVDITLYQTKAGWTMSWVAKEKAASDRYQVFLVASDFTSWNDDEKEEFTYNAKDGRFYLELNHESNGTVTNTMTNRFGILVKYISDGSEKYYSVVNEDDEDRKGVALKRTGTYILNHNQANLDEDFKKTKSMTLAKIALSDFSIIINPAAKDAGGNTVATISIAGDEVDEIQSGKYTFYYKITRADLKEASQSKSDPETHEITESITEEDLRYIRYFMWGNNALSHTGHNETDYLLASGKWPGQLLTTTAGDADKKDIYREEEINDVKQNVWCATISKLIETTDDDDNLLYYYEITVRIPKDQSAIGIIFNHDWEEDTNKKEQTQNFLDYDFYPDKVYAWEGVSSTPPVENMITKLYLHTSGGVLREDNGETLEDVPSKAIAFTTNGNDGIYTLEVEKMLIDSFHGHFYIGVTSEKSVEESDAAAANEKYTTVFSNSGAISFFHNEYIPSYEGEDGLVSLADVGAKPMFLTMPDDTQVAENVKFKFDRATSKLFVSAEVANELAHYVIYFINDVNFNAPHIKVYEANEDGSEKTLYTAGINGVEMHQKGANLFSGGDLFYRHDLWVPRSVIRGGSKNVVRKAGPEASDTESETLPTQIITPENAHTFGSPSALTFEFMDEDGSTTGAAGSNKFSNVPLVSGGVYGVSGATETENSPLNKIFIVDAESGKVIKSLVQSADGLYYFEGTLPLEPDGTTEFYLSTDETVDEYGVRYPTGDTYGARNLTETQILNNVSNALIRDPHVFSGVMVKGGTNAWIISRDKIGTDLYPAENAEMTIAVHISPDGAKNISFGFSKNLDDFEVEVEEVISDDADAPVMWFNLQGMRLREPQKGINIRVQGRKMTKVLVR